MKCKIKLQLQICISVQKLSLRLVMSKNNQMSNGISVWNIGKLQLSVSCAWVCDVYHITITYECV